MLSAESVSDADVDIVEAWLSELEPCDEIPVVTRAAIHTDQPVAAGVVEYGARSDMMVRVTFPA